MEIYIVQVDDTIQKIADKYDVSVRRLLHVNGIDNSCNLVPGQALLITYPLQTYNVEEGDTLAGIAARYGVTVMQLLRNNSFLADRKYIYPGETLIIKYPTNNKLITNGYTYPYIKKDTLIKTLPYLTYLSVFNYRITEKGTILSYANDTEVLQLAKEYGTVPLLMLSNLTTQGEANMEVIYEILMNQDTQTNLIENILELLKTTGYDGLNIMISHMIGSNQKLFIKFLEEISTRIRNEGYLLFVTLDPGVEYIDHTPSYTDIDYAFISTLVDELSFLQFSWSNNKKPPGPVCSIDLLEHFMDYVTKQVSPNKISLAKPLVGFDWELPFILGKTMAYSITLNAAITLATDVGAVIMFDEQSQTPYYNYSSTQIGVPTNHIVWFVDIRSIHSLDLLVNQYQLAGSGVWNIMIFYQQMWSMIISEYDIHKLIPDQIG